MTKKKAIESLERRIDFLAKRISSDDSGRPMHNEREEIQALRMAIIGLEEISRADQIRRAQLQEAGE